MEDIIWITYNGRRIPIKPGMRSKFSKEQVFKDSKGNKTKFIKTKPKDFIKNLKDAKESQPENKKWRVDDYSHTEEEYKNMKTYTTEKGSTIAITKDGDIVSVCSKINSDGSKDSGRALMEFAVKNGGIKLDSYDGNYYFYTKMGFEPVSWVKFDKEYAPSDWKMGRDLEEPIIFFKYTGKQNSLTLEDFYEKIKASPDYDTAMKVRDRELKRKRGEKK